MAGGETSRPTLFDIGLYIFTFLAPIFFIIGWNLNMIRQIFFVFGIFVLLALSLICKREREYSNKYLGYIVLWSMMNVFVHSFKYSITTSFTAGFINYCIMSEGFIYVLCGVLLFYLVVSYAKNFKIVYPLLAINILNSIFVILQVNGINPIWSKIDGIPGILGMAPHMVIFSALSIPIIYKLNKFLIAIPVSLMIIGHYGWGHSFSGVFALFVAFAIYLFIKRYFRLFGLWVILGCAFIGLNWHFFYNKAILRFMLWGNTIKEVLSYPFGQGFDNTLKMNMVDIGRGMMYRHNDYLNISRDMGIPFLLFILIPIYYMFKNTKFDNLSLSILIIMLASVTWTSMYFTSIASIAIILLALKEKEWVKI